MAKLRWRWIPCADYDLEGTESWLQAMAAQGRFLRESFAGFAGFAQDAPKAMRYRLNAMQRTALLDRDVCPDSEERELAEAAGWYFVCTRGPFFVYACEDAAAPELHTDPAVQALQLGRIRSDATSSLFSEIYFCVIHPLLWWHDDLFRIIAALPWLALGFALVAGAGIVLAVLQTTYLRGLTRRLRRGEAPVRDERHRRRGLRLRCLQIAETAAILAFVAGALLRWSGGTQAVPLRTYTAPLPFATLADLAGGGEVQWENADFMRNEITELHTVTAPAVYDFEQHAVIRQAGQPVLRGGLYVDYFETCWEWLARGVARNLMADWLHAKAAEPLTLPGIDEAWWTNEPYGQLLLRSGRRVMSVTFIGHSEADMTLEEALPVFVERFLAG